MKKNIIKIFVGLIIIFSLVSLVFINKNKEEIVDGEYKVAGITKSPLYLPVFVGIEKGYFKNLDVSYVNTTGGDIANTMLLSGEVDAVLNSLNVVINSADDDNQVIAIGELTHRGGMTLVSKVDFDNIETIVSAKNGGLPNTILEETTDYEIVANLSPQEGVTYFLNQDVDAIMAFEPFATQLVKKGYKTKSMNEFYNDIPFNCVLIRKANIADERNKIFMNGLKESLKYINKNDSLEIASLVKEIMEFKDEEILAAIIDTFKKDNVWNDSLKLSKEEYDYYSELSKMKKIDFENVYENIEKK